MLNDTLDVADHGWLLRPGHQVSIILKVQPLLSRILVHTQVLRPGLIWLYLKIKNILFTYFLFLFRTLSRFIVSQKVKIPPTSPFYRLFLPKVNYSIFFLPSLGTSVDLFAQEPFPMFLGLTFVRIQVEWLLCCRSHLFPSFCHPFKLRSLNFPIPFSSIPVIVHSTESNIIPETENDTHSSVF